MKPIDSPKRPTYLLHYHHVGRTWMKKSSKDLKMHLSLRNDQNPDPRLIQHF